MIVRDADSLLSTGKVLWFTATLFSHTIRKQEENRCQITIRLPALIKLSEFKLLVFFFKEETVILLIEQIMSCDMVQKRVYVFVFLEGQKIYKEKRTFLSNSSVIYLNSSVAPFLVFNKVFMTCKSIRVAQLASKFVLFVCVAEIVRQTTEVFDTLYLTRGLRIHCCFLKYLIEPFSKQSCSEINAFKVWFNDASKCVNTRAEEQEQAETHVWRFKLRNEKKLQWNIDDSKVKRFLRRSIIHWLLKTVVDVRCQNSARCHVGVK